MKLSEYLGQIKYPCKLTSDGEFQTLEQCTRIHGTQALTYVENIKYVDALNNPNISCVICTPEIKDQLPSHIAGVVITENPKVVFYLIHNDLVKTQPKHPTQIDPSSEISPLAYIAPFGVVIGKNVEIQPFAVVNEGSVIGDCVCICSGAVISGQSFNVVRDPYGRDFLITDGGTVRIEDGVEICCNAHIARGTLLNDVTVLGAYAKIDALTHVGHGAVIGERAIITAGAVIGGNSIIGHKVWVGINATVSNGITIGDGARVSLGSVVTKDVSAGETVTGNFAIPHQTFLRNLKRSLAETASDGQAFK